MTTSLDSKKNQKRSKTHFYADILDYNGKESIVFKGEDWSHIHWSGWSESNKNHILRKLIENHWKEEWVSIYAKFNQALLDIAGEPTNFRNPLSCLVLYKKHDHKERDANSGGTVVGEEIHSQA